MICPINSWRSKWPRPPKQNPNQSKTRLKYSEKSDAKETKRHVEAEGRQCVLLPGDVKDPAFCRKAVKTFGKLDVLVNNAAFQQHADSLGELTEERFDETMKTNV